MFKYPKYDRYGNEILKIDIIPNLKRYTIGPSKIIGVTQEVRKKFRLFLYQKHTCQICGSKAYYIAIVKVKGSTVLAVNMYNKDGVMFNIDHIIPSTLGGSNEEINKQCTCEQCNTHKGSWLPDGTLAVIKNGKFIPYKP